MKRRKPALNRNVAPGVSQEVNKNFRTLSKSKVASIEENAGDDIKDEPLTSTDSSSTQSKRSKRGKTVMHCLIMQRAQGIKQDVDFNDNGQTIGPEGTQLQSYIGVLVREKLRITYKDWHSVPPEDKERIWESVNLTFNVDPNWKMGCLKSASNKFRQFKADLTKKYIFSRTDGRDITTPPVDYPEISASDWTAFVVSRLKDEFKKQRQEQQERRAQHEYPHGISRKGYAQLGRENPHLLGNSRDINQASLWAEARKKLAEKHENAGRKKLAEKLIKIGEFISKKNDDTLDPKDKKCTILETVLEKAEHPGRLRGVGSDITPTLYYKVAKGKNPYPEIARRQEQKLNAQGKRLANLEGFVYNKLGSPDEDTVEKGSCSPNHEAEFDMIESDVEILDKKAHLQGKKVELSLESRTGIAGYGLVMNVPDHELPNKVVCVAIDEAVDENAPLPIPTEECKSVGDAVGYHVAWPLHLLKLKDEKTKKKMQEKKEQPLDISKSPAALRVIYHICKVARDKTIEIDIDNLFGADQSAYVNFEDVEHMCLLSPISCTCIVVYIWHLFNKIRHGKHVRKFRFVNPYHVGYVPAIKDIEQQRRKSIASRTTALAEGLLGTLKSQLVLVPCNVGFHWILTIIDPHNQEIGIMDPLYQGNREKGDWEQIVETGLNTFLSTLETTRESGITVWTTIKGPKQPDHQQCGFHVMRYMKDIIESGNISTISSLHDWFKGKKYSIHEIDEVRKEWANCVQEYIGK